MIRQLARASLLLLVLGIGGCVREASTVDFAPFASGEVRILRGHDRGMSRTLTQDELIRLSGWLKAHRDGWRDMMQSAPEPGAAIVLDFANGAQSTLQVFQDCPACGDWYVTLIIASENGDKAIQRFTPQDFGLIRGLVHP